DVIAGEHRLIASQVEYELLLRGPVLELRLGVQGHVMAFSAGIVVPAHRFARLEVTELGVDRAQQLGEVIARGDAFEVGPGGGIDVVEAAAIERGMELRDALFSEAGICTERAGAEKRDANQEHEMFHVPPVICSMPSPAASTGWRSPELAATCAAR